MSRTNARDFSRYGWPELLLTATAAAYTQVSRWTLLSAVERGELAIAGRRGRSYVFRRADLDAWLVGTGSAHVAGHVAGTASSDAPNVDARPSAPVIKLPTATKPRLSRSLTERLEAARRGEP